MTLFHPHEFILGRIIHTSPFSMDCFKGKLEPENPNKSHISWENRWFRVKMFPYNQSIAGSPSVAAWDMQGALGRTGRQCCLANGDPIQHGINLWGHVGPFTIAFSWCVYNSNNYGLLYL